MFESLKYFDEVVEKVKNGYRGKIQQGESSYYRRKTPHDGEIDEEWSEEYKERFIRAMTYPPYSVARFKGKDIFNRDDLERSKKEK